VLVDLSEVISRLSGLVTVNKSGSVIDYYTFDYGLGGLHIESSGGDAYARIVNYPTALRGAAMKLYVPAGASNYCEPRRDLPVPATAGIGVEGWFASIANPLRVRLTADYYDGAKQHIFSVQYNYEDNLLQVLTGYPNTWYDLASGDLDETTICYNKLKHIMDLSTGYYNRVFLNERSYTINNIQAPTLNDARFPYLSVTLAAYATAGSSTTMAVGCLVTTQNETLAEC